jgi:hypothetical protein
VKSISFIAHAQNSGKGQRNRILTERTRLAININLFELDQFLRMQLKIMFS